MNKLPIAIIMLVISVVALRAGTESSEARLAMFETQAYHTLSAEELKDEWREMRRYFREAERSYLEAIDPYDHEALDLARRAFAGVNREIIIDMNVLLDYSAQREQAEENGEVWTDQQSRQALSATVEKVEQRFNERRE